MKKKRLGTNVQHPKLAQAFAIKLFEDDLESVLKIASRTHIKKSTIVRTALSFAFDKGFSL